MGGTSCCCGNIPVGPLPLYFIFLLQGKNACSFLCSMAECGKTPGEIIINFQQQPPGAKGALAVAAGSAWGCSSPGAESPLPEKGSDIPASCIDTKQPHRGTARPKIQVIIMYQLQTGCKTLLQETWRSLYSQIFQISADALGFFKL